ncbi:MULTISPECIES: hypothetical protein [unclassified Oceanispirochaeta]|uniref:hypothetical protein n=1 Tax=unclassified Oceanispirochaeta TaxID=2635722 RepID=UPI000E099C59|nr:MULTISPECIES: hypothetical protein [unclassified Oceanispirochaeta]MBF9016377.1 hypothetical protein [Oceanispirochaeta sp. M2]NPD72839.1 hypothetical protein [Oceanispirochaeta sp. M1]RDG31683.1 hypothetical protein DV872_12075 [Oceanispirochaeta sp. M1]
MLNAELYSIELNNEGHFKEEQWTELVDRLSMIFSISPERKIRILNNKVMKLTAAIPFIANCSNPMRIALSHLSIYLVAATAGGKDIFKHSFCDNDNLLMRLERISHFDGGDEIIINRGMKMLALSMLNDHKADAIEDMQMNKYNPINMGVWNYENISKKLIDEIVAIPCQALDLILDVTKDLPGYWDS